MAANQLEEFDIGIDLSDIMMIVMMIIMVSLIQSMSTLTSQVQSLEAG